MEIGGGNGKLIGAVVGPVELWNPRTPSTMLCLMEPAGRSASGSRCRRWSTTPGHVQGGAQRGHCQPGACSSDVLLGLWNPQERVQGIATHLVQN